MELVVKMEVEEVEHGRPRQGPWLPFVGLLAVKERRKKKVKERGRRKGGGGYIMGIVYYNIAIPFKRNAKGKLASPCN